MKRFFLVFCLAFMMCQPSAVGQPARVVALEGSLAQIWLLAGGELAGVTGDAVERGFEVGDAAIVGSVKSPSLEAILAISPDLVLMPLDIAAQRPLIGTFEALGIECRLQRVDTFSDYLAILGEYCGITGREDLFAENGLRVAARVREVIDSVPNGVHPRVLLMRAYSSGVKAKGEDNIAGAILADLGCVNIAGANGSLLEDLSLEAIVREDPDFIFITTMGDEDGALAYLKSALFDNPAWNRLTAVARGKLTVLDKELFHYKPNNRWFESYEILRKALYE